MDRDTRYKLKRKAKGWINTTVWLPPETVQHLDQLSPTYGSRTETIREAVRQLAEKEGQALEAALAVKEEGE